MGVIDSILNLVCVLLWFNWRSALVTTPKKISPMSLVATLKKAEPRRGNRWMSAAGFLAILLTRSLFYWNVGSAWNWTPSLELGVISLPFRSDHFLRMVLFSALSFALVLGALFAWLVLLSVVNRKVSDEDPYQKLVRVHLGCVERLPGGAKLLLPLVVTGVVWGLACRGLVQLGIVPPPVSAVHIWQQAVLLGLTSYLVWEPFIIGVCVLYLANSYVYLGRSHFWSFVNTTGSNLLFPVRRLPLQIGKVDLSPVLAVVLVVALSRSIWPWLPRAFQSLPL